MTLYRMAARLVVAVTQGNRHLQVSAHTMVISALVIDPTPMTIQPGEESLMLTPVKYWSKA